VSNETPSFLFDPSLLLILATSSATSSRTRGATPASFLFVRTIVPWSNFSRTAQTRHLCSRLSQARNNTGFTGSLSLVLKYMNKASRSSAKLQKISCARVRGNSLRPHWQTLSLQCFELDGLAWNYQPSITPPHHSKPRLSSDSAFLWHTIFPSSPALEIFVMRTAMTLRGSGT